MGMCGEELVGGDSVEPGECFGEFGFGGALAGLEFEEEHGADLDTACDLGNVEPGEVTEVFERGAVEVGDGR
jgi:hypothetical protein